MSTAEQPDEQRKHQIRASVRVVARRRAEGRRFIFGWLLSLAIVIAFTVLSYPGQPRHGVVRSRVSQKTVAQSFLMLAIVQPLLPARSSACSAPLV